MKQDIRTFDDTLARTGNEQSALTRGRQMARERARDDAPTEFCSMCVHDTPLAYENASDIHTINFLDDAAEAVARRIAEIDGELTDTWWVRDELVEAYRDAYFMACPDADDCEVCSNPAAYSGCGHERIGEECPVRM